MIALRPTAQQLVRLRAAAAELRTTHVRVERLAKATTVDPTTGDLVPTSVLVWEGLARLRSRQGGGRPRSAYHHSGGLQTLSEIEEIHLPIDAGPAAVGDRITVVSSPDQPLAVGRTWRVIASHLTDFSTAQRLSVEDW